MSRLLGWNGPYPEVKSVLSTLPPATRANIMSVARVFAQIDQRMLDQIKEDKDRPMSRFSNPGAMDIESCLQKFPQSRPDGSLADADVVSYLSDTSCLRAWTMVQDALIIYQGGKERDKEPAWDSARSTASLFLHLGLKAMQDYSSLGGYLQYGDAMASGIEARLTTLLAFNDIYARQSYNDEYSTRLKVAHEFWYSMVEFRKRKMHPNVQIQNNNSTLLTVSWMTTISCAVLLVPAWRLSTQGAGSTANGDFWLLLQSTCMQLLSLFTTFAPVYFKKSDRELPWPRIWTIVLVVLGVCCSAAALASYFFAPVIWASSLSFLASAVQACLVLQLALFADAAWSERPKSD